MRLRTFLNAPTVVLIMSLGLAGRTEEPQREDRAVARLLLLGVEALPLFPLGAVHAHGGSLASAPTEPQAALVPTFPGGCIVRSLLRPGPAGSQRFVPKAFRGGAGAGPARSGSC